MKYQVEYEYVNFDGIDYPTRTLRVKGRGTVTVAPQSLENVLMDGDGGEFVSEDARMLDEGIFYYVEDAQITWPTGKLVAMLLATVD